LILSQIYPEQRPCMELKFHRKTFNLLGLEPQISIEGVTVLEKIEEYHKIQLPASVREWYSIQDAVVLMRAMFFIHPPTKLEALSEKPSHYIRSYSEQGYKYPLLHMIWENQGVWSIATLLEPEQDPPVFLGLYEEQYKWQLHAQSFSDFIYAWAWDYIVMQPANDGHFPNNPYRDVIELYRKFPDTLTPGPTTYLGNAFFQFEYCNRYVKDGTLIMDYRYASTRSATQK
jgi:hypothetical protein